MNTENQCEKIGLSQSTEFGISVTDQLTGKMGMPVMRGEMRNNEPMSKHTSWRVGGSAERYYIPADLGDFANFLHNLPRDEPVYIIGLGSNLLVRDGGLQGTVVAVHAQLNDLQLIEQNGSGGLIYAGAGVACAKIARFAAKHNLADAEFLAGIPGTAGGALAMNAGCFGSETWEIVERVQTLNHSGEVFVRQPNEYKIGYRSVKLQHALTHAVETEWFAGGYFRLPHGNQSESR